MNLDELSDEEIEAVLNTPAFQKAVKYRRLAHGIEVLTEDDAIRNQLVHSILAQHSSISTTKSIEEVLDLFVEEVKAYTEGMGVEPDSDDLDEDDPLSDLFVDERGDEQ